MIRKIRLLVAATGLAVASGFAVDAVIATPAAALCESPPERGTWYNQTQQGPTIVEIEMALCGDQVLNGVPTKTTFNVRVKQAQSDGTMYDRGTFTASAVEAGGVRWIVARVPVGGYVQELWMRAADAQKPAKRLRVVINSESLDSKPSSSAESEFLRTAPKARGPRVEEGPPVVAPPAPLRPDKVCRVVCTGTTVPSTTVPEA